jgi:hypothetical protein
MFSFIPGAETITAQVVVMVYTSTPDKTQVVLSSTPETESFVKCLRSVQNQTINININSEKSLK